MDRFARDIDTIRGGLALWIGAGLGLFAVVCFVVGFAVVVYRVGEWVS